MIGRLTSCSIEVGSGEVMARNLEEYLALIILDQAPCSILDPEERRIVRDAASLRQIVGDDDDAIAPSQALYQIFHRPR